jgi:hypothetical protein
MPSAFGPDGARWQFISIRIIWICREDAIDDATASITPLAAAALHTSVGETETLFGRAPLMGELDEKVVHDSPMIQERNGPIRLDHSQENGAGSAG